MRFGAMPDDAASAMGTHRRQRMNRAFETVECVCSPSETHLECLVVIVTADFASCHRVLQSFVLNVHNLARAGDIGASSNYFGADGAQEPFNCRTRVTWNLGCSTGPVAVAVVAAIAAFIGSLPPAWAATFADG